MYTPQQVCIYFNIYLCLHAFVLKDVSSNRKLLGMLLNKRGFSVYMAEDGVDCLRVLNESPPDSFDLVFMDNTMPNLVC